jgi:hypothetical protein
MTTISRHRSCLRPVPNATNGDRASMAAFDCKSVDVSVATFLRGPEAIAFRAMFA